MTSGYRNHGIVTEDLTQVEQFLYLEKPIDPTAATAFQMEDVTIPAVLQDLYPFFQPV